MSKLPQWLSFSRFGPFRGLGPLFAPQGAAAGETVLAAPAAVTAKPSVSIGPLRLPRWYVVVLASIGLTAGFVWMEMRTSALQARVFSSYSNKLTYAIRDGACDTPLLAPDGPYDRRLGYRQLADLSKQLTARDFRIARQACPSEELVKLGRRGIAPPYDEKHSASLQILDRDGKDLYHAPMDRFSFQEYGEIPSLVVQSLLFVENRQLLDQDRPTRNPALEWDRLFFATANYALDKVREGGHVQGGSTLATQIEKFRHSPQGRTAGGGDKIRQILAASLRAYRNGTDTRVVRRDIVLDYLNSMPLGAAPGEGEVTGLGHGMWAWFGKSIAEMENDLTLTEEDRFLKRKAETYKQTLGLVMATRRPTLYLAADRKALEDRIHSYLPLLVEQGVLTPRFATAVGKAPLKFRKTPPARQRMAFVDRKATNAVRAELLDLLHVQNLYALDRYDVRVETSIDSKVQEKVTATLRNFADGNYMASHGFYGEHLLGPGQDPAKILYSFALYERTAQGNRLRVSADNVDKPLDINRDVKLELGSTAKLRTMANYLMVVSSLYERYRETPGEALLTAERAALDPLSRWVAGYVRTNPGATLDRTLNASLDRTFSADPGEAFFTGRGVHYFANFDDDLTGPTTLRVAFQHSVNLVYIRLMRELTQYYTAELDYDQRAILADSDHPKRKDLLDAAMDNEAREELGDFFARYRHATYEEALARMCGKDQHGLRRVAIFALAENPDASLVQIRDLAHRVYPAMTAAQDSSLRPYLRAYAHRIHSAQDEGYLLGRHPLEPWLLRDLRDHPGTKWAGVVERSGDARKQVSEWIYPRRFKEAQNLRIRIELERRAFGEIHKAWKQLGYPFDSLVPSLATAIGSSADRPQALAELVGIIQCQGTRVPFLRVEALHFGEGTPYETHFEPAQGPGERVMPREVAVSLKALMETVVEGGTGRRAYGCLTDADGQVVMIGGKTGSGDNRSEKFASSGAMISSRAVSRTASFVFTVGDHFFGMLSAYVIGEDAGNYYFTSSLALQAFKTLAPSVEALVRSGESAGARSAARTPAPRETTPGVEVPPALAPVHAVTVAVRP